MQNLSLRQSRVLGLLKSETGADPIAEVICINPKTYSILLNSANVKTSAKGVQSSEKHKLRHTVFDQIHEGAITSVETVSCNIISRQNKLFTMQGVKKSLRKIDKKRHWVDANTSVAFGHPSIKRLDQEVQIPENVNKNNRNKRKTPSLDESFPIDLNFIKRRKIHNPVSLT